MIYMIQDELILNPEIINFNPAIESKKFFWIKSVWDDSLIKTLKKAKAIILPQSVTREFYYFCKSICPNCFPNYDIRFRWEGKVGDALLFKSFNIAHPKTFIFPCLEALSDEHLFITKPFELPTFPFVVKSARGGEGTGTWLVNNQSEFQQVLKILKRLEWQGQEGFIIQEYIPFVTRDLRVVVIGDHIISYWRYSEDSFYHNISKGAKVDKDSDPKLQEIGKYAVKKICELTKINLAAFDLIFKDQQPLFLEINYTFGRTGLGGSEAFYKLLKEAINNWLKRVL